MIDIGNVHLHGAFEPIILSEMKSPFSCLTILPVLWVFCAAPAFAQGDLVVYADHLSNGFQDWSWGTRSLTNSETVHSGVYSIRASLNYWEAVSLAHSDMSTALYGSLSFWMNGGTKGGQVVAVQGVLSGTAQTAYRLTALPANTWKQFTIPLSSLGVADKTDFDRFWFQLTSSGTTNPFYIDDIQLVAKPIQASTTISIAAGQTVRPVDARWFGMNAAVWDSELDTTETAAALKDMGTLILRFPGGSLSDQYYWSKGTSGTNTWKWSTSFADFAHLATNIGAQACITVNYGTSTAEDAAAWVASANVTHQYGFKYWEIGNENYGSWESDANTNPHDPYTYANRAADYIQKMKAVDPEIKVGVVVVTGEDDYANYTNHPVTNPRTGETHNGWTPVLLNQLKSLSVKPDFLVYHRYAQNAGGESDTTLLQSSSSWANDAADLRQQMTDYFGTEGGDIELLCTENNSVSSGPGKQTTSLVNALFMADSFCQLMQTEFNGFFWWDLRNGQSTGNNNDSALYGWRLYGDYGVMIGKTNYYPTYYSAKMLSLFQRPGDAVVATASDNPILSAYAVRKTNGGVGILVINKDPTNTIKAQLQLTGFSPQSSYGLFSYGIPQDVAGESGVGDAGILQTNMSGAGTQFTNEFAPYSLTLLNFYPTAPSLSAGVDLMTNLIVTLHGQNGVRYVLQNGTNLVDWSSAATNTLISETWSMTNECGLKRQFWRAVWLP